jgi:hypothetical protein
LSAAWALFTASRYDRPLCTSNRELSQAVCSRRRPDSTTERDRVENSRVSDCLVRWKSHGMRPTAATRSLRARCDYSKEERLSSTESSASALPGQVLPN